MKKQKAKKYQSVIVKRILLSVERLTLVLLLTLSMTGVFAIGGTNAGFFDIEESLDNRFEAGSLDMVPTYIEYFNVVGMNPDQTPDARITYTNEGSLDYRYNIKFRQTGGNALLCDNLHLVALRNGSSEYEGTLSGFNLQGGVFTQASFDEDNWDFTLSLPADADSSLENLACQWHVDTVAWQTNIPTPTEGFVDEESVGPHQVATGTWLTPGDVIINEVMWMGSNGENDDEWIELKNMTNKDINLSNWNIVNGGTGVGSHIEIPNGYSIKANDYFLLTKRKWNETMVYLSSDLPKSRGYTHLAGGMNLHNDGEQLILEDKDGMMIDQTPLGAWPAGNNGSLKQSMERNDIPGDGTVPANWHTCVSGAANGAPYWDTTGTNFGTPLAANLSPIVMNEFVPNPIGDDDALMPEGEWIELYNILDEDIDVANWYFTNSDEEVIAITAARTESGETVVPGQGRLVVYLGDAFMDNDSDKLSLYDPKVLEVTEDDVREDVVSYHDAGDLPEGKSFARFPDGEGIWLDPEATPGDENVMTTNELKQFRLLAFDACYEDEKLNDEATEDICSPIFLQFIGMIDDLDDTGIDGDVLLEILDDMRRAEAEKLLALVNEDGVVTEDEEILVAPLSPSEATAAEEVHDVEENEDEVEEEVPVATPTPETETPSDPVSPTEEEADTEEATEATETTDASRGADTETSPIETEAIKQEEGPVLLEA